MTVKDESQSILINTAAFTSGINAKRVSIKGRSNRVIIKKNKD